jgi:hypothetical protein
LVAAHQPSVEEVHRFVGRWWDFKGHSDIHDWIGDRLPLCPAPSIRWYTNFALMNKKAGLDWREKLTRGWTIKEPDPGLVV